MSRSNKIFAIKFIISSFPYVLPVQERGATIPGSGEYETFNINGAEDEGASVSVGTGMNGVACSEKRDRQLIAARKVNIDNAQNSDNAVYPEA
jgi:hypothetical protein